MIKAKERISTKKKNANSKQWYKDYADSLAEKAIDDALLRGEVGEKKNMKVNYDLYNNILNIKDFEYVCKPFGTGSELPATMVNRDIVSGKVKALLGMEMKRPFLWKVVATDSEATTRKEEKKFSLLKKHVVSQIMAPIKKQIMQQKRMAEKDSDKLSEEEKKEIDAKLQEMLQAKTPEEVRKYMQRDHQDPAEVMSSQLLRYLIKECDIDRKFNECFKHGLLSSFELGYVGILNDKPQMWPVNPMNFNCDKSGDIEFVENGDWATYDIGMTPSQLIKYFNKDLEERDIDAIYESWEEGSGDRVKGDLFSSIDSISNHDNNLIKVTHCVWKALRKVGFLKYKNLQGIENLKLVSEDYTMNEEQGDISIEWEWVPEGYETWKIWTGDPIYVKMRPIPGQFKDINNLYYCSLPYKGVIYDNINSKSTSLMDRLKVYQYYYNIVMYRLELLIASDKGKKVMMNINNIPDSAGIDVEKWQYFFEASPFMWYDDKGEGYSDVNTTAKVIDLSLASDIQKYIQIAEYLRKQAGLSNGITEAIEGQISPDQAVSNSQRNLIQSSNILEPYFEYHSAFKKNILTALIETAKVAYSNKPPELLSYATDDMTTEMFKMDYQLLDNSTLGIYMSNAPDYENTKQYIERLAQAAMQNQAIQMSDVISIIKQDNIVEAEEILRNSEEKARLKAMRMKEQEYKSKQELLKQQQEGDEKEFEREKAKIFLKEREERKTQIITSLITGASYNPDLDMDNNDVNDFLEMANKKMDMVIKDKDQKLKEDVTLHQKNMDREKLKNERRKLDNDREKLKNDKIKNRKNTEKTKNNRG